jgi:hypothetical protein
MLKDRPDQVGSLDVETREDPFPAARPDPPEPDPSTRIGWPSCLVWTFSVFVILWLVFFAVYRRFPYLKNGSDLVFSAKLDLETSGQIFPDNRQVLRVLIFGNSKILAGFVPSIFDQMAAAGNLKVSSFNSGFPGSDLVLPPLKAMCERGQAPDVLLLTLPWRPDPPRRSIFRFIPDDHAIIQQLFPFRNMARDLTSFLMLAPTHGGLLNYYREAEHNEKESIAQRGHYLILQQSRFPGGRLPDDFHLESDQPNTISERVAVRQGSEITDLNQLIRQYHMDCYYVPFYLRIGEAAAPPGYDQQFATLVEGLTPCKLLGPSYFLYPNKFFSDQTHLNGTGARVYTEALYNLVESKLSSGRRRALQ